MIRTKRYINKNELLYIYLVFVRVNYYCTHHQGKMVIYTSLIQLSINKKNLQ